MIAATTAALLAVSALCAAGMGYAAQRGSICAVRGVEQLIDRRSPQLFLSFLRCSAWVALVSLPLIWLTPMQAQLAPNIWPTPTILGGAFLFGVGAAINGGCSFATVLRLAAGEASFLLTLIGLSLGFALQRSVPAFASSPVATGPSALATPHDWSVILLGLLLIAAVVELGRWPLRGTVAATAATATPRWRPEAAAAVMGVTGGVLYAVHGSWMYTVALDRGLAAMMSSQISDPALGLLLVSLLAGGALAARRMHLWRWRPEPARAPQRLIAGIMMGFGGALVPGGNDVLVLHALPALSAHAVPAYVALVAGVAAAILARRAVEAVQHRTRRARSASAQDGDPRRDMGPAR